MNRFVAALPYLSVLALIVLPVAVSAQDASGSNGGLLGDKTQFTLGIAESVAPRYAGSDDYRVQTLPVIAIQRGIFFLDTTRGLGAEYLTHSGFYISTSINYDFGRVQRDSELLPGSKKLAGMGNVPGSVTSRTMIGQQITPYLMASAEAEFTLKDGTHRSRYRAGLEYTPWKTDKDVVAIDLNTHWGNRGYNQAYFGVTELQSSRSGFAPYSATGGLYAYSLSASWNHTWTPHWSTSLIASAMRYTDKVEHSPIVQSRFAAITTLALTYSF